MKTEEAGSSAVTALSALLQQQAAQNVSGQGNQQKVEAEKDDGAKAVKQPSPTLNVDGQKVGSLINTTA